MAKDDKPADLMNYEALQQDALRGVVRAALARAAGPRGLPGEHHFYISFRTDAAGVEAAPEIVERYPEEMTIVLQNQFWDLAAGDEAFSVTLQFGGQPKSLSIPYRAVTRFYDPSVQYLLQFVVEPSPRAAKTAPKLVKAKDDAERAPSDEPKIVSLDQFRKK
jgi:hypothetical protein